MIESMTTTCSAIDGLPLTDSPAHRTLRAFIGCAAAGMTYEDTLYSHPPPGEEDLHDVVGLYSGYDPYDSEEWRHRQLGGGRSFFAFEESEAEAIHQQSPAGTAAGSPGG